MVGRNQIFLSAVFDYLRACCTESVRDSKSNNVIPKPGPLWET